MVDAATRAVLNNAENLLVSETSREALAVLDEDAAIELEGRIRQAEAFERALSRVSRRVAALARESASALRAERQARLGAWHNALGLARVVRLPPGLAAVMVVGILALLNVVDIRVAHASLVAGPVCAAGLTAVARLAGLSWRDLGLGPGTWRRGLRWACGVIAVVGVVIAVGAALPLTREAFRDTRYRLDWGSALLTALVLIPVGTVLLEEMAFRGVLWGLLRRAWGTGVATVVSSVLFGLWHVLPSLRLSADNQAISGLAGRGNTGEFTTVLASVLFTAASGVVFCELRRRSGSVLASASLHWATNGLSVLASSAVWAWGTR